jgi:hypothetical protein
MKRIRSQITRFEKKIIGATHPELMLEAAHARAGLEVMIEQAIEEAEKRAGAQ